MSSGGALPPQLTAPFSPFSYFFQPQQATLPAFAHQQQRIKLKRQRQRVDAGEPRNSYQQPRPSTTVSSAKTEQATGAESEHQTQQAADIFSTISWMQPNSEDTNNVNNQEEIMEEATDLRIPKEGEEYEIDAAEDRSGDEKSPERSGESRNSNGSSADSTATASSSSRRKCYFPQKSAANDEAATAPADEITDVAKNIEEASMDQWEKMEDAKEETKNDDEAQTENEQVSAPQAQLSAAPTNNQLNDVIEAQKKFYASLLDTHKKMETEKPRLQRELSNLASTLKTELLESLSGQIDKIFADFIATETARNAQLAGEGNRPLFMHPLYQYPVAAAAAASHIMSPFNLPSTAGGIFPPSLSAFGLGALNAAMRKPMDEPPAKKHRKQEQPSVRSKMTATASPVDRVSTPGSERASPSITRATPLSSYFPSMVSHSLYGTPFDRDGSPLDSDGASDCGPYDPNVALSSTLTPMHLRKAKLMFFYTRYPNSSLLKTYFPDIRFNKNNTAQLVKWFSNFREFYYIQMEKYARQAMAEGIRRKEDIIVTTESDIFKTLNQHYNRNNHVQPPDRLVYVVQETLREFFWSILHNKDTEPSWKKTIYKVICRLDDPIPEYFKDPNFLERLEP